MSSTAMSSEDITALFAGARDKIPPFIGQPTDQSIHDVKEVLLPILLEIPYDRSDGKHNLVGLLVDSADYIADYGAGEALPRPKRLGAYPPNVSGTVSAGERAEIVAKHRASQDDYAVYDATERELRRFLLDTFDETYYLELKNSKTYFTRVTPAAIISHLQKGCLGRHAIDVLALTDQLRGCHVDAPGIPEYINMLEEGQRQSQRIDATNPITDATLLTIATGAMLKTKQFPRANEDYERLKRAEKTWDGWKIIYKRAQEDARVTQVAAGDNFAGAVVPPPAPAQQQSGGAQPSDSGATWEDVDAALTNLANAARAQAGGADELVKSNAVLTATNAELVKQNGVLTSAIEKLRREVNSVKQQKSQSGGSQGGDKPKAKARRPGRACKLCEWKSTQPIHFDAQCWELTCNADKRPAGWTSCM